MNTLWFFEDVNLFKILCPHKFKEYKMNHDLIPIKNKIISILKKTHQIKYFLLKKEK